MADINNVTLIGRLTKDMDVSYTAGGTACGKFSVAVSENQKKGSEWVEYTSFFDVVTWGKTAEKLKMYMLKGQKVAVDGRLRQDRWEKDGKNYRRVNIVAENIQLLGGKKDEETAPRKEAPQQNDFGFVDYNEDIPF